MSRVTWGVAQVLLGLAIATAGAFARQLPFPNKFEISFRPLSAPSFDTSVILALAGVVGVLASFIALSGGFRGIMILRYVGVIAFFAGIFVEKFRIPSQVNIELARIEPVPSPLSVGLIIAGAAFLILGLINLIRAGSAPGSGSPRMRHR